MLDPAGYWKAFVLIALFSVAVSGLWLVSDGIVTDAQHPRAIDSCTTITEPGRYALTADITESEADTCIRIQTRGVHLDGRGHRVDGVGEFGTAGVVVRSTDDRPVENVSVRNVTVTDWDDGIRYIGVVDGAVVSTTTENNRVGLSLLDAYDTRVANNVAHENRLRGISLFESSANNTIVNNTATDNALFGIHLVEGGVRNNTLVGNTASNNEFGIVLIDAHDNTLAENTVRGNRIAGIWLSAARDNQLSRNTVSNRFYGIFLADRSAKNGVSDNEVVSNTVGIRLRSSDRNRIVNNSVRSSSDNAILLISSDDNVVTGNVGSDNTRGVTLTRSTGNSVENNTVSE
ncbi:copper-binding protein [Haloferax sp. MBLA0076]|uniref:Copper-binding protein n=1 Tax=Haloferax litoreum TaxID=2666140 RepID=A0A6A8GKU9_9EURY|nr:MULTISPECIES: NosD domain-containing protein [Haloferax]KAB1190509.1 copper-binding protein [Haloferax sp. CBA1148]MRX23489.1 copper-binding protein [Haloferax litoreum]